MSDNYYQFAIEIPHLRGPEQAWLRDILECNIHGDGWDILKTELGLSEADKDDWDPFPDFDWDMHKLDGHPGITTLSCYAEENGKLSQVAHLAHRLMKKFDMQGYLKFTGAGTCSKMHTDQFGGDAVWITKKECVWSTAIEKLIDDLFETRQDQRLETEEITITVETK